MFGQDYTRLMTRKIRSILLICNNYDSFSLEEDGHIEGQISQDYAELNLSNPPSIDRVESTLEALELLKHQGDRYDLIITMFNVGKLDVFEFSRLAKVIAPHPRSFCFRRTPRSSTTTSQSRTRPTSTTCSAGTTAPT